MHVHGKTSVSGNRKNVTGGCTPDSARLATPPPRHPRRLACSAEWVDDLQTCKGLSRKVLRIHAGQPCLKTGAHNLRIPE